MRYLAFLSLFIFPLLYSECDYEDLIADIQQLEKTELHLHLGGSWPLSYLEKIATPEQFDELLNALDQVQSNVLDYHEAFSVFALFSKIVNTEEKIENGVVALCQDLINDNVTCVEMRTGLKNMGSGLEGYLQAVLRGIERGCADSSLKVGLILSLRRDTCAKSSNSTIDLAIQYKDRGVVGLDVSGNSTKGDGKEIIKALHRAKKFGIPITLHLGESKEETPEQQMRELTQINPNRIGHGVHLCNAARKWVIDRRIPIELCPSSALMAGMVQNIADHPALNLLKQGYPVVICTDDTVLFNTTLTQENALVAVINGLSVGEIEALQKRARKLSFIPY